MKIDDSNFYNNGEIYDLEFRDKLDDIQFYIDVCNSRPNQKILELGCGTGRITVPMAKLNHNVTGFDLNIEMLKRAQEKSKKLDINWIQGDFKDFQLNEKFDFIISPFNSIQHLLKIEDLESFLKSVKGHLRQNGKFIFDIYNPNIELLAQDRKPIKPVDEFEMSSEKQHLKLFESSVYDQSSQINNVKWYYSINGSKELKLKELQQRCFYPQEMDYILMKNSFKVINKFGSFSQTDFKSGDPYMIYICC